MSAFIAIIPDPFRGLYGQFHLAPGVVTGARLLVSGQVGVNADMTVPADLADEVRSTFQRIGVILAEAGATFADIVALDSYHVSDDLAADAEVFGQVRAEFMGEPYAAWTAVGVAGLLVPGARVEVKAEAVVPS